MITAEQARRNYLKIKPIDEYLEDISSQIEYVSKAGGKSIPYYLHSNDDDCEFEVCKELRSMGYIVHSNYFPIQRYFIINIYW